MLSDASLGYVWGLGLAYAVDSTGTIQAVYHDDGLGSVRAITNASGALIQTYTTDAFGNLTASPGTSTQPFQYTGEPHASDGLSQLKLQGRAALERASGGVPDA